MLSLPAVLIAALAPADDPLFVDVSAEALPGVSTVCGSPDKDWILEVNGGGLALGDLDRDGDVDLVVVRGSTFGCIDEDCHAQTANVYLNDGDGTFTGDGSRWRPTPGRWGTGCALGDVNGDGFLDLLVTHWGPDQLFLNDGGKGFVDATADAGLATDGWSTSAAFLDFDDDGHLDLYVVGYLAFDRTSVPARGSRGCRWKGHEVMCGPEGLVATGDRLYRGRGDGTFVDVTAASGVGAATPGFGLGVTTLDLEGDGDTDLYVSNDSTPNHLWENQGDGTFREVGFRRGVGHDDRGREQAGMGIACADWNADGKPDLFVTNFSGESNALYRSGKGRGYRERSSPAGLGGPSLTRLGWGTGFADFDLDGALDLFVLNGHVYPEADRAGTDTSYAQDDQLFRGDGERFVEGRLSDGPARVSRAGAAADLDGDGDLDLVTLAVEGPVQVLRNRAPADRHWIAFELQDTARRDGIGARVELIVDGVSRWAEVRTAGGFQSSVPPVVHFGLGDTASVDAVVVHWLGGATQRVDAPAVDARHRIDQEVAR